MQHEYNKHCKKRYIQHYSIQDSITISITHIHYPWHRKHTRFEQSVHPQNPNEFSLSQAFFPHFYNHPNPSLAQLRKNSHARVFSTRKQLSRARGNFTYTYAVYKFRNAAPRGEDLLTPPAYYIRARLMAPDVDAAAAVKDHCGARTWLVEGWSCIRSLLVYRFDRRGRVWIYMQCTSRSVNGKGSAEAIGLWEQWRLRSFYNLVVRPFCGWKALYDGNKMFMVYEFVKCRYYKWTNKYVLLENHCFASVYI